MNLAYLFPDVEGAYVQLIRAMVRVDAGTIVPDPRPVEFVRPARVGGEADLITDNPRVTFFVWGASWGSAQELAQLVRQRVMSTDRLGAENDPIVVYRITEVGGVSRAPDPPDGSPCYQFTIQIKLRGKQTP